MTPFTELHVFIPFRILKIVALPLLQATLGALYTLHVKLVLDLSSPLAVFLSVFINYVALSLPKTPC